MLNDGWIRRVLFLDEDDNKVTADLERLQEGSFALTRASTGEMIIKAVQRLLIFLGYSTSTSGAYTIDGDFGRGTNRGVAQFQFEHDLPTPVTREQLCYVCTYRTAPKRIDAVHDVAIDSPIHCTKARDHFEERPHTRRLPGDGALLQRAGICLAPLPRTAGNLVQRIS